MPGWATVSGTEQVVNSVEELVRAISDPAVKTVFVGANLAGVPAIHLAPGKRLCSSENVRRTLQFSPGVDGVRLSTDNVVADLNLLASDHRCAIQNDASVHDIGTLRLCRLTATGRVKIFARDNIRAGHVVVEDLDIVSADARAEGERPHEYGVDVLQGAFTLWNMQAEAAVVITADIVGLSAGRAGAPVLGSGIFVSGAGETGGRLQLQHLQTKSIYSDGGIEPGTASVISGGVFVVYGARVDLVENLGPVTTYGPNDMALDNWGAVDRWISRDKITTWGPSGVGFVNFGVIDKLQIDAPIETFGPGARGFNVYTGSVRQGEFDRIVTHADGAVGVQISQPVGCLMFHRGIETFGAVGDSLVKGVLTELPATALSVKAGGSAERIIVQGGLRTHGAGVAPLEQNGTIGTLQIDGGFSSAATQ
jgi:hypothetical protein